LVSAVLLGPYLCLFLAKAPVIIRLRGIRGKT
jgi:hypothetical protein